MRKIQHYPNDAFEFHKKAVSRKKASQEKTILQSVEKDIEDCYTEYNDQFKEKSLSSLQPFVTTQQTQEALIGLYQFRRKVFSDLFYSLTTTIDNRRDMLCPNCTLTDCSQLDHYMPKSLFPEFSANPLNLMQCCSICNQKKLDRWLNGVQPIFLNLYIDDLPPVQYLFVDITMADGIPRFRFYLQKSADIESILFNRIESHYEGLDLCERFAERSDNVISEIHRDYIASKDAKVTPLQFWEMQRSRAMQEQSVFGFNYWKSILILTCLGNSDFCSCLENRNTTLG